MTLYIIKEIFCDGCGTPIGLNHLPAYLQRAIVSKVGWIYKNGRDFCPECKSNQTFKKEDKGE
jgi:hypothetical protein